MNEYIKVDPGCYARRWVAYLDLLGFRELVRTENWVKIFSDYTLAIEHFMREQVAQRYAQFAFLCGSSLTVIEASDPGVFVGGQQHPVDFEAARGCYGALDAARVIMHA